MNPVTRALLFAREELGLDVESFASLLEIDVATVREWEAGSREAPSKAVARCARALSLTIHELLSGDLRPDPATSQGLRPGAPLDEVAKALSEGRIDRVEAHRLLDLALYEPLPEHPLLSDAARAPLRSLEDDVRAIVWIRLATARRTGFRPAAVHRTEEGWRVSVVDQSGDFVVEELLSFDLDAERDML